MRVIVFGAGRVGAAMARDLAADDKFEVTVADIDRRALAGLNGVPSLTPVAADLRAAEMMRRLAEAHDFVVGAVPGPMEAAAPAEGAALPPHARRAQGTPSPPDGPLPGGEEVRGLRRSGRHR